MNINLFSRLKLFSVILVSLLVFTSCSQTHRTHSLHKSGSSTSSSLVHSPRSGTANVAYAGSLLALNEKTLGPAFTTNIGYRFQGQGNGSYALANLIRTNQIQPNVFESIGSAPIQELGPRFTKSYVTFATSPLVIAYNPNGTFGPELTQIARGKLPIQKLFETMAIRNFHLGRTDPLVDPQGQAFLLMLELAVRHLGISQSEVNLIIGGSYENQSQLYTETSLDSYLQSGQLDCASAFLSQAVQLHLHYISLPNSINQGDQADSKYYSQVSIQLTNGKTIHGSTLSVDATTLNQPTESLNDKSAAASFLRFLTSRSGLRYFRKAGFQTMRPVVHRLPTR